MIGEEPVQVAVLQPAFVVDAQFSRLEMTVAD